MYYYIYVYPYSSDGDLCWLGGPNREPYQAGLRFHGPGSNREIQVIGDGSRAGKSWSTRSITGFYGPRSTSDGLWALGEIKLAG